MLYGLSARGKRVKSSASFSAELYEHREQHDNDEMPTSSTLKNFFFTQSPFTTSVIPRPVLEEVIFQICEDLKARAISTPYLLLSYREQTDNKQVQALIDNIFVRNQKPLTGDALLRLIRNQDPYILAGALKWCWCRVPGGIVTWKAYNKYKEEEEKLGSDIPLDAFLRIFPKCVDSDGHMRLVVYFFELVMALATHGRVNGMGETKLPRLAGNWAFDIRRPNAQQPVSFADGLAAWSQAAEASNHLFFAYLRWLTASAQFKISRPLESLMSSMESYPPPSASVYYGGRLHPLVNVPMVTLTVTKLSATPLVLLRRIAKTIQFDDPSCFYSEDEFNTLYMVFNDPNTVEQKITSRSYDVLKGLCDDNRITTDHGLLIKETRRLPYDLRAKTWSKYYNHACVDPVTGELSSPLNNYIYDEDQLEDALKAEIPSQEKGSRLPYPHTPVDKELPSLPKNRASYVRPTSAEVNWELFARYGFDKPEGVTSQSWAANRRNAKQMESSVTAAVSKVAIDDFFVWVWMCTLSEDQTEVRKATFGRSLVIETMLDDETRRWIVVEEILTPAPKPLKKSTNEVQRVKSRRAHDETRASHHGRRTVSSPAATGPVTGKRPKNKKLKEHSVKRKPVQTPVVAPEPLAGALNQRLTKQTPLGLGITGHDAGIRDFQVQRPPPPPPKDDTHLRRNHSVLTDVNKYSTPVLEIATPTLSEYKDHSQFMPQMPLELIEESKYTTPELDLDIEEFRDKASIATPTTSGNSEKKLPRLPDFAPSLDKDGNIISDKDKPLPPIKSDSLRMKHGSAVRKTVPSQIAPISAPIKPPTPPNKTVSPPNKTSLPPNKTVLPTTDSVPPVQHSSPANHETAFKPLPPHSPAPSKTPTVLSDDEDGKTVYFSPTTLTEDEGLATPVDTRSASNSSKTSVSNQSDDTTADILNGYYSHLVSEDEGRGRLASERLLRSSDMESKDTLKGVSGIIGEETATEEDPIGAGKPATVEIKPADLETDKAAARTETIQTPDTSEQQEHKLSDDKQETGLREIAQDESNRQVPARYSNSGPSADSQHQEIHEKPPSAGFKSARRPVPARDFASNPIPRAGPFPGRPGSYPHSSHPQSTTRRQFVVPRGRPLSGESFTSNSSYLRAEQSPISLPPYGPPVRGNGRSSGSSDNSHPGPSPQGLPLSIRGNAYGSDWSNASAMEGIPPRFRNARTPYRPPGIKPPGYLPNFDAGAPTGRHRPVSPAGMHENRLPRPGSPAFRARSPAGFRPGSPAGFRPGSPARFRPMSPAGLRPASPGGFQSQSSGGYRPQSPAGLRSASPGGYRPQSPSGMRSASSGSYRPESPGGFRSVSSGDIYGDSSGRFRSASPGPYNMPPPTSRRQQAPSLAGLRAGASGPYQAASSNFHSGSSMGAGASSGMRGSSSFGNLDDLIPTADPKFASPSRRAFQQQAGRLRSPSASLARAPDVYAPSRTGRSASPSPRPAFRSASNQNSPHIRPLSPAPPNFNHNAPRHQISIEKFGTSPRRIAVGSLSPMATPPPSSPPNLPVPEPSEFSDKGEFSGNLGGKGNLSGNIDLPIKSQTNIKPLPLDPRWMEVKNSLKDLKNDAGVKTKILPPVVDAPVDEYLDHAKRAVQDPSVITGNHVKMVEVKDTPGVGQLQPDIDSRDFVLSRSRTNLADAEYIAQHPELAAQRNRQAYEEEYRLPLNSVYHSLDQGTYQPVKSGNSRHNDNKDKSAERGSFMSLGSRGSRDSAEMSKRSSSSPKKNEPFVELVSTNSGTAAIKQKSHKSQGSEISRFSIVGLVNAALKH